MTKQIITIGRQYGSGGREIGEKVATQLGYAYYDKELIRQIAKQGDIDIELVNKQGEGIMGKLSSLLSYANPAQGKDEDTLPFADRLFLVQSRTIKQIADGGPCVIIGHSADYFLQEYPDILNVFVHANWDSRVERVMRRNNLGEHEAVARIKKIDKNRASFYEQYTEKRWGNASNYHVALSSSSFGIDKTAEIITHIAQMD
ncbi:MAG: cytidylate kinase-like family protein [Coriobacteriales bacterium]|jgi:cytidylate kinase|nr:cytidylate kinase-like family protein [Coriobacteriales bacterium]